MTDTSAGLRYYGQCAKTSQPGTNKYIPPRIKRNSIQVLYHGTQSQCSLNTTATLIKSPESTNSQDSLLLTEKKSIGNKILWFHKVLFLSLFFIFIFEQGIINFRLLIQCSSVCVGGKQNYLICKMLSAEDRCKYVYEIILESSIYLSVFCLYPCNSVPIFMIRVLSSVKKKELTVITVIFVCLL